MFNMFICKATTIMILLLFLSRSECVPYGSIERNQRGFFQPPRVIQSKVFTQEFYKPPENVRAGMGFQISFAVPLPFNPVQFTPMNEQNWNPVNNLNNPVQFTPINEQNWHSINNLQDNLNIHARGQNYVLNNAPTNYKEQGKFAKNNIKEDNKTNDVDNLDPYDIATTPNPYFTTEYTTGTTDEYDTTTFLPDELNRSAVSGPIVATLLGG